MDKVITTYFRAWNEQDPERRGQMLRRCVTDDAELVDPLGRWQGVAGIGDRIGRYQIAAPGTKVVAVTGVDAHHDVLRYAWKVVDRDGSEIVDGIDVAQRSEDGRLKRILMFHGSLPAIQ